MGATYPPWDVRAAGSMPGMEYTCDAATDPDTVKTYDIDVALTHAVIVWFPVPNNHPMHMIIHEALGSDFKP